MSLFFAKFLNLMNFYLYTRFKSGSGTHLLVPFLDPLLL